MNGLFTGFQLFGDSEANRVTEPYIDSSEYLNPALEYSRDQLKFFRELESKFSLLKTDTSTLNLDLPKIITPMSLNDFKESGITKAIYIKIRKKLPINDGYYVQLDFIQPINSSLYEEHRFFIFIDQGKNVKGWFFD